MLRPGGRYIELGRLVGSPARARSARSRVLALHALVWGLRPDGYDGLLAYARERASNHFRLLGMEVYTRVEPAAGKAEQPYVLLVRTSKHPGRALALGLRPYFFTKT